MVENLKDIQIFVKRIEKEYGSRIAYRYLAEDSIVDKTFTELAQDIHAVASWLSKNGYSGKHIAIIGSTSYHWVTTFLGILCSANVVVPVDKMLSAKEMLNVLEMGDVDTVFVSEEFAHVSEVIRQSNSRIDNVICFADACFAEILHTDPVSLPCIDPEAMAEILFTSGTTGVSKGVMLSQKNLCANISDYYSLNILDKTHCEPVAMSVLPIHHTYELTIGHLGMLYRGVTICINDRLENIASNMNRFKPGFILVVPTIAESFYKKIMDGISSGKNKRKIALAKRFSRICSMFGIDIRRKLYKSLLDKFGGNLTSIVVGGAALRRDVADAFTEFGVNMFQGYGLTECAPLVATNYPRENRLGSV